MVEKLLTLNSPAGLHARPASVFVTLVSKYKSKVTLFHESKKADAKSILFLLALGLKKGSQFTIKVEGEDEQEAMNAIVEFFETLDY